MYISAENGVKSDKTFLHYSIPDLLKTRSIRQCLDQSDG